MKRPILLAALLASSTAMIQPAQANTVGVDGNMLRMFDISTPSAGKVNFIGTGTANFNQSIGTQNNFNVGSSTNLGVNAQASSTEDYTSEGKADLRLAGTSRLQQTIGTATSAFNVSTAAESSATAAHTSANQVATQKYGTDWSQSYETDLKQGWEHRTEAHADVSAAAEVGWYKLVPTGADGETTFIAASADNKDSEFTDFSKKQHSIDWQAQYDSTYSNSYQSAVNASQTTTSESTNQQGQESQAGIISGIFSTIDYGSATSQVTASDTAEMDTKAKEAAAKHIVKTESQDANGNDTSTYAIATENGANIGNYASQTTWGQEELKKAYDSEYTKSFNAQFSSAAGLMRSSDSSVTVKGIGVIADVNADAASSFMAHSNLLVGAERDGNGNGNASSGASLATSSYANQSNASTASAFMQAFSGGLPEKEGTTVVTKVEAITDTDPGTTGNQAGYKIYTDTVKTVSEDKSYSVDAEGNLTAL